ncbi:MAG: hypothetical protein FWC60_04590, partial [Firmicutes bacterium]|nr:hypothetical protein [Bacillota bacterium]
MMKFIKKFKVLFAMVLLLSLAALAQMGPNFTLGNDDNGPPGDSTDLSTSEATYRLTNTVIAPLSNQLDQDLTLTVISAAPTQFETWQNPVSGAMPPDLTVSLNVNFSPSYSSGGSIVVPVDCTPDRSNPLYANFDTCGTSSTLKPLFVPLEPNTADLANMPDVADYSFDGSKITLTLMSSADAGFRPGTVTIPLKFKFELDYLRQIPNDQYMWLPTAQVYLNGSDVGNTMAAAPVKGASQNEITYSPNFMMPADPTQYTGGAINLSPTVLYNYFQQSDLDLSYQNQYYIELPTGSSSNGLRANYTGG